MLMRTTGNSTVTISHGTPVATAQLACSNLERKVKRAEDTDATEALIEYEEVTLDLLRTEPASAKEWHRITTDGLMRRRLYEHKALSQTLAMNAGAEKITLSDPTPLMVRELDMDHYVVVGDHLYAPTTLLPFADGGRPQTREDLEKLEFSLEDAIDPSIGKRNKDGSYPPLSEEKKQELYDVALRWWMVWTRDARAPRLSRLIVLQVPTGGAQPVAQKPYPLPYAYLDAVRDEVQKLLDGGLIEPCISNWASPVLVRLKKDSTPDKIRLKLICDFRKLNEVSIDDSGSI